MQNINKVYLAAFPHENVLTCLLSEDKGNGYFAVGVGAIIEIGEGFYIIDVLSTRKNIRRHVHYRDETWTILDEKTIREPRKLLKI